MVEILLFAVVVYLTIVLSVTDLLPKSTFSYIG